MKYTAVMGGAYKLKYRTIQGVKRGRGERGRDKYT